MRRALFLLPLLVASGWAQELRWGLHALGSTSARDLASVTDDATGFGIGVHALLSDGGANGLRFRLEGQVFPGREDGGFKTRVSEAALTADWLYGFSGRISEGPYSVVSAGLAHWRTEVETATGVPMASENRNSALISGGFGWQLGRTFGLEAQAWWTDRFRRDAGRAQGIAALFTIRF